MLTIGGRYQKILRRDNGTEKRDVWTGLNESDGFSSQTLRFMAKSVQVKNLRNRMWMSEIFCKDNCAKKRDIETGWNE